LICGTRVDVTKTDLIVDLHDVAFRWPGRAGFGLRLNSFSIRRGETVLLLGESGSGKSTLLSLICGTIVPDGGTVRVAGRDLGKMRDVRRDRFRAEHVGVIFQQFNLLPFGNVRDNILLPLRFAPDRRARVGDLAGAPGRLCEALKLPASILTVPASRLSVGQQQRVAVARALIGAPDLIVADEPTSALDADTQTAFLDLLFQQARAGGISLLMVSHDARLADRFDRVAHMDEIVQRDRGAA
jgi:putative ABC transport system ATP-binding protein